MNKLFILGIATFALISTSCNSLKSIGKKDNTESPVAVAEGNYYSETAAPAKTVTTAPKAKTSTAAPKAKISMRAEKFTFDQATDQANNANNSFFVILGSFSQKENANRFKSQLAQQGFKPFILLSETGNLRICVNSYKEEGAARSRVMSIRTNYPNYSDAWLLIKK